MSFLPQLGVGPTGSDIDNDVMDHVLRSASIGSSIGLAILNTSEATAMFYLESSHGFDFHQVKRVATVTAPTVRSAKVTATTVRVATVMTTTVMVATVG